MLKDQLFEISTAEEFTAATLEVFKFQYEHVQIYRTYCQLLKVSPSDVGKVEDIPFLPIQFFKSHKVLARGYEEKQLFTSSGTTGSNTSKHFVADLKLYEQSFQKAFTHYYGNPEELTILALLPTYLEREDSSLIYMVDHLIGESNTTDSGFYLQDLDGLIKKLQQLEVANKKTLLLGVSYALLDLIEAQEFELANTIIMETGGMKGRRKEMIKEELHAILKKGFGVTQIHSEYGMTELLSQGYSKGDGIFNCPPWMQVLTRDTEDSLSLVTGKTGGINVIDLANLYSCSFIATQDLGKLHSNGSFEVLGRFDTSDIRGCNLMVL